MSSITWKWDDAFQSGEYGFELMQKQFDLIKPDQECRRAMGLPLALSLSATLTATLVAQIGEYIIKGLGNVLGCCCNEECSLLTGLGLLGLAIITIPSVVVTTPFYVVATTIACIALPIWTAIDPDDLYIEVEDL